ncbi:MAG: hypothetical protein ABR985_03910 [Methanotrichaceae archaeon]|jgi:hypothetical protein
MNTNDSGHRAPLEFIKVYDPDAILLPMSAHGSLDCEEDQTIPFSPH